MAVFPPLPLGQSFVICREIIQIPRGGVVCLIGPIEGVVAGSFPAEIPLSVYAQMSDARGRYEISLQLVDDQGDVVWTWSETATVEEEDPLQTHTIHFRDALVSFPRPGRYDLVIVANGEPMVQHAVRARDASEA